MNLHKSDLEICVTGNKPYNVEIKKNGIPIVSGDGGYDSISIMRSDGSAVCEYSRFLYDEYEVNGEMLVLRSSLAVPEFIMILELETTYRIVHDGLIKKQTRILQRNNPLVLFKFEAGMSTREEISKFWAFDDFAADERTDMTMQRFPALGYAIGQMHIGLVSENGWNNHYVRNRRKRKVMPNFNYDAFEPIETLPDPNLMGISGDGRGVCFRFGSYMDANGREGFYNTLSLGKAETKTMYIFAEECTDIRQLKLACQAAYADGRGFVGNICEKVLYADSRINIVTAEAFDRYPHSVPAPIGYAPDMYCRDTFWTVTATRDRFLNESLCERFWDTQDSRGCVGTIITPVTGSVEVKDNESTILLLLWAYLNKKRFGACSITESKINLAIRFCLDNFDPERTGRCISHFPLSQQDISHYEDGDFLYVNQGMYAVFLRCARAFGHDISDEYMDKVEVLYQEGYDDSGRCLRLNQHERISTSFDNLVPEFLSLWLFEHKILTDDQVCEMITSYPDSPVKDARGLFIKRDGDTHSLEEWPFKKNEYNQRGTYYNGGSWLRGEVMAYACVYMHGYPVGRDLIVKRLQAELDRYPDDPVSHEFLPTDPEYPYDDWIRNNSVFSWNVFALIAEEMAGLRNPVDDCDANL